MPDLTGQSIDRYQILEMLGQGGMATVYKAYDTRLSREVAIKVIRTELFSPVMLEKLMERFDREAKSLARLANSNIVNIFDYGEYQHSPYLVMAYLSGGTLKARMGKPMPAQQAVRLLIPIARALAYAHSRGIIHRDVKPANILFSGSGDPILTDFGIVKIVGEESGQTLTGTGIGIGTPEYMAPEQWLGQEVDGRADIYALGIILFELVTGHKPYEADTPNGVMLKHFNDPIPEPRRYLPGLPVDVVRVIFKALAKKPEYRYESMQVFTQALEQLIGTRTNVPIDSDPEITTDNLNPVIPDPDKPGLKPWAKILIGIVGVGLLLWLVFGWILPSLREKPGTGTKTPTVQNSPTIDSGPSLLWTQQAAQTQAVSTIWAQLTETSQALPEITDTPEILTSTPSLTSSPSLTPTSSLIPPECTTVGQEWVSPEDGMTLVCVPAGSFTMGSNRWFSEEKPEHTVMLNAFWLDKYEVTNAQYQQCVSEGSCKAPDFFSSFKRKNYYGNVDYANYPVINVDWYKAQTYCEWAKRQFPTEAQWEKAARGTQALDYPWGNTPPTKELTNYNMSVEDTTKVGSYPTGASPYGVMDMFGNVWEWLADWYDTEYYSQFPVNDWPTDPINSTISGYRSVKGPGWIEDLDNFHNSRRYGLLPTYRSSYVGIRCAYSQP